MLPWADERKSLCLSWLPQVTNAHLPCLDLPASVFGFPLGCLASRTCILMSDHLQRPTPFKRPNCLPGLLLLQLKKSLCPACHKAALPGCLACRPLCVVCGGLPVWQYGLPHWRSPGRGFFFFVGWIKTPPACPGHHKSHVPTCLACTCLSLCLGFSRDLP